MSVVNMPICDFCGKSAKQSKHMVAGGGNEKHICGECIQKTKSILDAARHEIGDPTIDYKILPFDALTPNGRA
jgi:ATP-dependent protease Clp ATPase subunit